MKTCYMLFVFFILAVFTCQAQEETPSESYYRQGQLCFSSTLKYVNKIAIDDNYYGIIGVNFGGSYFILNKLAVSINTNMLHYKHVQNEIPINFTNRDYDNKNLVLTGANLRYHFYNPFDLYSLFIQTGYSFGKFVNYTTEPVHQWNFIGFGATSPLSKNLGMLIVIEAATDNLHKNIVLSCQVGFNYFPLPIKQ